LRPRGISYDAGAGAIGPDSDEPGMVGPDSDGPDRDGPAATSKRSAGTFKSLTGAPFRVALMWCPLLVVPPPRSTEPDTRPRCS
jgi:hypothetical protein